MTLPVLVTVTTPSSPSSPEPDGTDPNPGAHGRARNSAGTGTGGAGPTLSHTRDIVLRLEPDTTIAAVAGYVAEQSEQFEQSALPVSSAFSVLLASSAVPGGADLYLGDRALDPSATVRDSGLVAGSRVSLGAPAPEPEPLWSPGDERSHWYEVHAVGGPDAGRVWAVGPGAHDVGSAAGCTIRLGDGPETDSASSSPSPEAQTRQTSQPPQPWRTPQQPQSARQPRQAQAALAPRTPRSLPERGPVLHIGHSGETWLSWPGEPDGRVAVPAPPTPRHTDDHTHAYAAETPAAAKAMADEQAARPAERQPWPVGVDVAVGDTLLRLVDRFEPDAAVTPATDVVCQDFNRPPRIVPPLLYSRQRFQTPPGVPTRRPIPILIMLAPMVMGLAFVYFFQSMFFLIIMLFTPLLAMSNWYTDRRGGRRKYRKDSARYRERRAEAERELLDTVSEERLARCSAAPDPAAIGLTATGPGRRLWERRRSDPDYLFLRVGTVDQPSLVEVEDPAIDGFQRDVRWNVPDVPLAVDVAERGVVGVAGDTASVGGVARWLIAQAAVLHSPRDLRIEVLTDHGGQQRWEWTRWLPHARPFTFANPGAGPFVMIGNDPETVAHRVSELLALVKARAKARGSSMGPVLFSEPDVVVVLDGARRLRDVPGMVQVLTDGPRVRVFAICLDTEERLLPEECTSVVRCDAVGLTVRQTDVAEVSGVRPDTVTPAWCDEVARGLSPLRDVTPDESGGLPDQVRLLDLLGLADADLETAAGLIAAGWERRPASTSFPLGAGFDGPFVLDLVRDGPHGLVAGTTGAGKSELLQTLVASLAAHNHPDEMGFVLVDYKGGSAFHGCVRLPHTLGMVTDLDQALAGRALESLAAELRGREEVLAAATAKDVDHYRSLRARDPNLPALPRLVIVIDEFATLVREVPEFVPGLVSLAQRGRSLGIHMVLATQRPAGVVTGDIRANTNLRIALRVTDTQESSDVIDAPDAAFVSAATPGRALARLAARSSLPFQTAYVGAINQQASLAAGAAGAAGAGGQPEPAAKVEGAEVGWPGLGRPLPLDVTAGQQSSRPDDDLAPTDLDVLVDAITAAAVTIGYQPRPSPWLPALGARVLLDELVGRMGNQPGTRGQLGVLPPAPYAIEDLPALQAQRPVVCDLATFGHLYVIGTPRSGRSQVLRTLAGALATTLSSADVHLYGIDGGGGALAVLATLPHCGAVVRSGELERLSRLLDRFAAELKARQVLLGQHSCASLDELRAALPRSERPAHLLLLVDGWDSLAATLTDHDGGRLYELILTLLREGAGVGIHLVMTSERSLLAGRAAGLGDHRLLLRLNERTDYSMINVPPQRIPAFVPPGRGWRSTNQAETQIALLAEDPSGQAQAEAIRQIAARRVVSDSHVVAGRRPFRVDALPETVTFADAFDRVPKTDRRPLLALLGLGGDEASPLTLDFAGRAHTFLVAGPPGSGRSNTLATLAVSLLACGTHLVVVTPRDSPLRRLAAHADVDLLTGPVFAAEDVTQAVNGGGPAVVVLVDDVDLLGFASPLDPPLREIVATGRDRGVGLAYAGTGESLTGAISGWIGEAKRSRQGVLLAPQTSLEGDLLGTRIPPSLLRTGIRPGRGHVVDATGTLRTVVVPHTVLR